MILTVNIGNTHITVGGYEQDTLIFCGRLHSDPAATVEEYAIRLVNLLQLYGVSPAQIEGGILGSVVPMLSGRVLAALQLLCKARILTVGPGLKSGIKLRLDNPAQLGAELLCGAVAALAFAYDMPLVLILVGIVYICETLSDIIQVGYFKLTHGKRIFKMAPLHHHFEMCGWSEKKVVAVFATVSLIFCLLAVVAVQGRFLAM